MDLNNYSRRRFLKTLGLGAAALSLPGFKLFGEHVSVSYEANIGLQLFTIRKQIEKDLEGTISKIAKMGFIGIETWPLPDNIQIKSAAKVFKDNGLKIIAMHNPLPVGDEKEKALRMAEAYQCDRLIFAGWPENEKYKDLETVKKTADTYNEAAAFLRSNDIKFGLHNHWWEFELHHDYYPFYYLLEHLDKEIFFEIDTYWAKCAGRDPAKIVADFGKRAPLLHIKDGTAVKGDQTLAQIPVGQGTLDFPAIVKAGGINTKWMIVEFDDYAGNIFDGIKSSYDYLIKNKLAKGNISK
jgi:sugar phosphate isomerase/epimerase